MTEQLDCPCDFCNAKKYTVKEYLEHIDEVVTQ